MFTKVTLKITALLSQAQWLLGRLRSEGHKFKDSTKKRDLSQKVEVLEGLHVIGHLPALVMPQFQSPTHIQNVKMAPANFDEQT